MNKIILSIINIILWCCRVSDQTSHHSITHEQVHILEKHENYLRSNITVNLQDFSYEKIIKGDSLFKNLLVDISEYEYNILISSLIHKCFQPANITIYSDNFAQCIFSQCYTSLRKIQLSSFIKLTNIRLAHLIYKIYRWCVHYLNYFTTIRYGDIFHADVESCLLSISDFSLRFLQRYILVSLNFNDMHEYVEKTVNFSCIETQYKMMKGLVSVADSRDISSPILSKIIVSSFNIKKKLVFFNNHAILSESLKIDLLNINNRIKLLTFYYVIYFKKLYEQYIAMHVKIFDESYNNTENLVQTMNFNPSLYTIGEKIHNFNSHLNQEELEKEPEELEELDRHKRNDDEIKGSIDILHRVSKAFSLNIDQTDKLHRLQQNNKPRCTSLIGDSAFTKKYINLVFHRAKIDQLYSRINTLTSVEFFQKNKITNFLVKTFKINGLREFKILKSFITKPLKVLSDVTASPKFLLSEEVQTKYKGTFILNKDNSCLIKISKQQALFKEFLFLATSLFGGVKLARTLNDLEKDVNIIIDELFKDMEAGTMDYFKLLQVVQKFNDNKPIAHINQGGVFGRYLFTRNPLFRIFILIQEPHIFSITMDRLIEVIDEL